MFAKISSDFLDHSIDYHKFKSNFVLDKYYSKERNAGSAFYKITYFLKFQEAQIKNIFTIPPTPSYAEFTGGGLVTPHTDGGNDTVALNFYLSAPGDATIFYEKIHPNVQPYPGTRSYNVNELQEITRFNANPFDAYLLDVTKIHGIQKSGDEPRNMISFRWKKYSFEEIYNSLTTEKILWTDLK